MFGVSLGDGAQLRALEPWNAAELAAAVAGARDHLAPWALVATRVVDVDSARRLLQHFADRQARDTGRYLGIWLDGTLVGAALFRTFDTGAGVCELGRGSCPRRRGAVW